MDVNDLRQEGFSDEAILQATLTVGYFNFVNRVALATGIDPANDAAKPYEY
jgi:alkylhydroperoxidase family enzyme